MFVILHFCSTPSTQIKALGCGGIRAILAAPNAPEAAAAGASGGRRPRHGGGPRAEANVPLGSAGPH